ncbi:hypothetical protein [Streptomyces sp. SPB074]|uniref:hypothetical protein n=1 Tax=Streptomyces sp. (strain SPB074) TaxID=465543 RepID=UPI00017F173C|nr:hypothetical protein [Streptomyces sp. SPB074]EDY42600.1 hypothetical protein SSBG_00562 [Streptomyces sp. SPB074]
MSSIRVDEEHLPAFDTLTPEQRRGAACVWCGTAVQPGIDDVDLGARRAAAGGSAWFPRGCRPCAYGRRP